MKVVECTSKTEWDAHVNAANGHPLQLWGWGEVKSAHGWKARRYFVYGDHDIGLAAQVLVRSLPFPFRSLAYIPRGPVAKQTFHVKSRALDALSVHVKTEIKPVLMKIEPDALTLSPTKKWVKSNQTIQAPKTIQLNLEASEDELLLAMTKKTRQYIRKSAKDVMISELTSKTDLEECLEVYKNTSERAGFPLHDLSYYYSVFDEMGDNAKLYAAKIDNEIVSFLWLCTSSHTAFELYGGMTKTGQEFRANYALKWHAIQEMKRQGVKEYDFGGLIGTGVSTFKKGWSETEIELAGAYDLPMTAWYPLWAQLFPFVKKIVRKFRS